MAQSGGIFVRGEVLAVESFGQVHTKVIIHTGGGEVVEAVCFGDKAAGKADPLAVDLHKLADRASVTLQVKILPARGDRPSGFQAVAVAPAN